MKHSHILLSLSLAVLLVSCEESAPSLSTNLPTLDPVEVEDNGSLVFILKATIPNTSTASECGFYVSDNISMTNAAQYPSKLTGTTFAAEVTLQGYNRKYYVCSYISNGRQEILSEAKTISIGPLEDYVTFGSISLDSYDRETEVASFSTNCSIADGVEVTKYGILWGTSEDLKSSGTFKELTLPGSDKSVTFELPNLKLGEQYYICQYVTDADVTVYEDASKIKVCFLPTVTTNAISEITDIGATCGGTVIDDGGVPVTKRGIIWSTSPNPTISQPTKTVDGSGNGSFTSSITGLEAMTKYYVRSYASNSVGTSYGEQLVFTTKEMDFSSAQDLSSTESANCYIISSAGKYKFKPVKGNSTTSVGNVASCEVLWETFGTSTAPVPGDLISYSIYKDDYICFISNSFFREGNAVIAAKDASGNILWSWHIWLTDTPQGQEYNNNAGVMMDRNLGATSATPGDVGALGLLYQWGRKDPFLGSSSTSSSTVSKSTISWPSAVESTSSTGTIDYATAHPTTFIEGNSSNGDWYYTGCSSTDDTRWQSSKTIYDPCPAGWRVPDGGSGGVWATAFGTSSFWARPLNWNSTYKGMDFSNTDKKLGSSGPIWYPASGRRYSSGGLGSVGSFGSDWSVSPNGKNAYYLSFNNYGYVDPANDDDRANGQSVRCLQE
ncbi:MAG: hypothetical protein SO437_04420 [Candidatus Cryptobacteroides sp.]|nr:hypothetical protein [Candidatus Cryptobacteroides sp.]